MFYSTQKIVVPVMIIGLGNNVFVRQLKLIWQNQKLNVKKIFQSLCLYFACYLRIWDVLLNAKFADESTKLHSLDPRNISSIVTIFFLGKELSMKPVVITRNIYSFMNRGVCLHTESSTEIGLQFRMNSA